MLVLSPIRPSYHFVWVSALNFLNTAFDVLYLIGGCFVFRGGSVICNSPLIDGIVNILAVVFSLSTSKTKNGSREDTEREGAGALHLATPNKTL